MKADADSEEDNILAAQKEVDDINTKIFTSWDQTSQNINSTLSKMEKNINVIKKDQTDIKNYMKGMEKEQTEMNKKIDGMEKKLDGMEKEQNKMKKDLNDIKKEYVTIKTDLRWLLNREQYMQGSTFQEIPFTVGEKANDLTTISTMEDINKLSLEEVKTFLAGYGESTHGNELTLKKKLATLHAIPYTHLNAIRITTNNT
jgi:chromosome segregation ATPase